MLHSTLPTLLTLSASLATASLPTQPTVRECRTFGYNNHNYSADAIRATLPAFYAWLETQGNQTARRAGEQGFIADYRTTIDGVCISASVVNNNCDYEIGVSGRAVAVVARSLEEQCDGQGRGPFGWGFYIDYDSGYDSRGLGWVITQACDDAWPKSTCNKYFCAGDDRTCYSSPPPGKCTISRDPAYDCDVPWLPPDTNVV